MSAMWKIWAVLFGIAALSQAVAVLADEEGHPPPPHHGPKLTDEQRACLEKILGKPQEGKRPEREKVEAAFKSCGIDHPHGPPPGRPPRLTDEQKACVEKQVGKPEKGKHPDREKMEAAFKSCGIEHPPHGPPPHEGGPDHATPDSED